MQNTSSRKPVKKQTVAKPKPILSLQQKVEKWALPVAFVLIGGVMLWTFVHGYMTFGAK